MAKPAAAQSRAHRILALDATMSRQPTWDLACALQAELFDAVTKAGAPQRPTGLFPRSRRVPLLALRRGHRRLKEPDGADLLPGRPHSDRQSARPRASSDNRGARWTAWCSSAMRSRKVSTLLAEKASARAAWHPGVRVPGRPRRDHRAAFKEFARLSKGAVVPLRSASPRPTLARLLASIAVVRDRWSDGADRARPAGRPPDDPASGAAAPMNCFSAPLLGLLLARSRWCLHKTDAARAAQRLRLPGRWCSAPSAASLICWARRAGRDAGGAGARLVHGRHARRQQGQDARAAARRCAPRRREMELDDDTGGLEGWCLPAATRAARWARWARRSLGPCSTSSASTARAASYLRLILTAGFPAWREDAQADGRRRQGVAPGSGAMTKEEAYKVLGLETGAPRRRSARPIVA